MAMFVLAPTPIIKTAQKKDIWSYWQQIRTFDKQTPALQQEIFDFIMSPEVINSYHCASCVAEIMPHLDPVLSLKLFTQFLTSKSHYGFKKDYYVHMIIWSAYKHQSNQAAIRDLILKTKSDAAKRMLLALENITMAEEEAGLRALSLATYPPTYIFEHKYKPTLDALKKLPTVMRLEALETLLNVNLIGYNVFENITNQDDFKNLLFSAAVKYQERAEVVWKKYLESLSRGIEGIITIKGRCDTCGDYEIQIKSSVAHTKVGLEKTQLNRISRKWCAMCGHLLAAEPQIKESEWKENT